jgi:hypothetical protein
VGSFRIEVFSMKSVKFFARIALALTTGVVLAGAALGAPARVASASTVQVTWTNPADFTEEKKRRSFGLARETVGRSAAVALSHHPGSSPRHGPPPGSPYP